MNNHSHYNYCPSTGRKLARDEIAAEMDYCGESLEVIRGYLNYTSTVATREAIARGRRYDHHLEMARLRKRQNRRRGFSKPNPWNDEAVKILKDLYPDSGVTLRELSSICSAAAGAEVSVSACIGKAYRLELPKRSDQPARNRRRHATQKEQYRGDKSSTQSSTKGEDGGTYGGAD